MTPSSKTAVVTGASSGIGAATARRLYEAGCNVVLAARREDRLEALATELGDRAFAVPTDVSDPRACENLLERSVERFGAVDVLVNNAGLGLYATIPDGDPEDWRRMFDVNVLGVLYATRAAARHMLERGSGDVVFISSLAGRRVPRAEGAVYAATKHAVTAIAQGLRMDVTTKGVRVTTIEPGLVRTEFPESSYKDVEQFYAQRSYAPVEAEDVAAAVAYAVGQPAHVSVDEVVVRPSKQPN